MTGYEWFCGYLAATGSRHQGRMWQCPAHEDATPSLSVRPGDDDVTLIKCFAGCTNQDVLSHLGLDWKTARHGSDTPPDLAASRLERFPRYPNVVYKSSGGSTTHGVPIATVHHVYIPDEVRLERRRFSGGAKEIHWEHLQGEFWEFGLGGRRLEDLPVYRRQEVLMALGAREPIVLCESESSVDALIDEGGIFATTWAGGAGSPQIATLREALTGATVVWIPDDDAAGRTCSVQIIAGLTDVCHLVTLQRGRGWTRGTCLSRWAVRTCGPGSHGSSPTEASQQCRCLHLRLP